MDKLEQQLDRIFQFSSFRTGQKEIIADVLEGKDVFGILPTGSGKSICYQLPAALLPGTTIVVSPLIALMLDQVKQLKAKKFKRVIALNSFMNPVERNRVYHQLDQYKLVYVSPEILQQAEFLSCLQRTPISLFVIDEAHCISQWGHEFRPDYMKLQEVINLLGHPPVLALSATVSPTVKRDIYQSLNIHMIEHIYPIDRENIIFHFMKVDSELEKRHRVKEILSDYRGPTLIYFSSRVTAELISQTLSDELPHLRIAFYHGGMDQVDRVTIQQQFMNDQLDVICCTSAFGMGIDKRNIRLIIHYHIPGQLESFIQEAGRAGRDGLESVSLVLYMENDEVLQAHMIQSELPTEEMIRSSFQKLYELAQANESIPTDELLIQQIFQLNETQWNFLYFQLEKHQIVKNKRIYFESETWHEVLEATIHIREKRFKIKRKKLLEMKTWITEEGCLRANLYKGFQKDFTKPKKYCCSYCGFDLKRWKPPIKQKKTEEISSWQTKLAQLLLVEGGSK
ncbi:RecQ family ATP-dependent DNA helicase [Virgibacillus soli]|uniref:RecQ family ATP-dependent DNA helicase n=1 Tax=Paracerasibacillus soli TaxID=480284 RepID=A0ABU5CSE6_9BACI|nr:RecQ family ATP-dependent DNA helicase [Virgibacillus soli]MDY0408338.1 RecQ family ATP-dependent DNA helicase [Virgibacillus soli]